MNMFNGSFLPVQCASRKVQRPSGARLPKGKQVVDSMALVPDLPLRAYPSESSHLDTASSSRGANEPSNIDSLFVSSIRPPSGSDSILSLYMKEAGEVGLLSPREEAELAARIQSGDEAARERMIRANLRFVIKIARDYENLGMPLLDLINEGNIGLMKAVERFDPAKGGKLTTYAVLWIKQQIRRALASQGKTIRLPIHVADKIYQLTHAEVRLRAALGREATDEELAHELGVKLVKISKLRRAAMKPASLDAPLGDDDSSTVAEVVADENAFTPFEQLLGKTETVLIRRLVGKLPEREAKIIRFRFGLDNGSERTLEDVGRRFKLTRERIRQLQNIALAKLRRMLEETNPISMAA